MSFNFIAQKLYVCVSHSISLLRPKCYYAMLWHKKNATWTLRPASAATQWTPVTTSTNVICPGMIILIIILVCNVMFSTRSHLTQPQNVFIVVSSPTLFLVWFLNIFKWNFRNVLMWNVANWDCNHGIFKNRDFYNAHVCYTFQFICARVNIIYILK